MKSFIRWVGRTLETKPSSHRPRPFRPQLEQLDERLVPSLSSAISIQHFYGGYYQLNSWTERDWYTVDRSTNALVEFQGTTRHNLTGGYSWVGPWFFDLSASVDPNTGYGEVFALSDFGEQSADVLYRFDSSGNQHEITRSGQNSTTAISATRDGHVYLLYRNGSNISYLDSNGNGTGLGAPKPGIAVPPGNPISFSNVSTIAASQIGGLNEVFAIGNDGYIYNYVGTSGQWTLVDSSAKFVTLSATPDNTVFAVTTDGKLYQETEHVGFNGWSFFFYWAAQDISGVMHYTAISADTDASGHDEVYAIQTGTNYAYLYDQGSWTIKDFGVYDIAAAGGGYFYDVNYDNSNYAAWLYQPYGYPYWASLGYNLN